MDGDTGDGMPQPRDATGSVRRGCFSLSFCVVREKTALPLSRQTPGAVLPKAEGFTARFLG